MHTTHENLVSDDKTAFGMSVFLQECVNKATYDSSRDLLWNNRYKHCGSKVHKTIYMITSHI